MTERKFGHKRDVNPTAPDVSKLVKAVRLPARVDLREHVDHVRDQGQTGSCVGQATARAIDVRARIMGFTDEAYPSALAIYAGARIVDRKSPDIELTDDGCQPGNAAKWIKQWGVAPESTWPFDESKANVVPPFDVFVTSAAYHVDGFYRINRLGELLLDGIRQALAQGYPVSFGQDVGDEFMNYTHGVLGPNKHGGSGHMTNILGYEPGDVFLCVNSWGTGWGEGGFYRCSGARIVADSFDCYVASLAPHMTEAA